MGAVVLGEAVNSTHRVQGFCPHGCGETLVIGIVTKRILCQSPLCPDPRVIADVIGTPTVVHHVAHLGEDGFGLIHPLRERGMVEDKFHCNLHDWLSACEEAPKPPGVYVVEEIGPHHFLFHTKEDFDAAHNG